MNPDLIAAPISVPESDPFLPLDPPGSAVDLSRWKQIPLGLMNEYRVQFDVFEGPLDLLLHLVKKQEVDIYQVNLTRIASEFVAYIDQMRELDLEIAGEFLVMAATLIYIKSRELLPADQKPEAQIGEEDEEDPRFELIRRLVEYKKFKDAAAELQSLETRMDQVYEHRSPPVVLPEIEPQRREPVSIFDLIQAVSVILKRFGERDDVREIQADPYTVSEKMAALRMLIQEKGRFRFSDLFAEARSRSEVVVTFLAMLELTRLRHLQVIQSEDFGEIEVELAPPEAPPVEAPEGPVMEESENLGTSPAQSTRRQESPPDEEPTED
jgi:segregation and condensation protein A